MKKVIAIVILIILVVGVTGAFLYINNGGQQGKNSKSSGQATSTSTDFISVNACDILTKDIAKQSLGNDIVKASTPNNSAASNDINVSTCSYVSQAPITGNPAVTPQSSGVWLIVRSAKSVAGADNIHAQFDSSKPASVQAVPGLGDSAFYNSDFRQLNVLKGNNWYTITAYKDSVLNGSLDSNKKVAEKLHFK